MIIKVFGPGCAKCEETLTLVNKAVQESGTQANVEKVTDYKEMMKNGIMSTPAVVVDGKLVCTGRVPSMPEILGWIGAAKG